MKRVDRMHTPKTGFETQYLVQTRVFVSEIRTNKIQGIAAVAIHARRAHIHSSIEVEILAIANNGALRIPTRGIRLYEIG